MNQIVNTKYLVKACEELSVPYEILDKNGNFLKISGEFFVNGRMPFNNGSLDTIARDKDFTHKLLENQIQMPKNIAYINPDCDQKYSSYIQYKNLEEILDNVEENFNYPVVVKMNRGRMGIHVYKCDDRESTKKSFQNIFNQNQQNYDYIALVQEYIEIEKEYRVIWFKEEIILLYEKKCEEKNLNMSPFHNEKSQAIFIDDQEKKTEISQFLSSSKDLKNFEYLGIDISETKDGKKVLLEINTQPAFNFFVRDNSGEYLVEMYKKILKNI